MAKGRQSINIATEFADRRDMRLRASRGSGGSLPNRVLIVLAVPLLAVAVATASQAEAKFRTSSQADQLHRFVADVRVIDLIRRQVEAEVVPSLADHVIRGVTSLPVGSPSAPPASILAVLRQIASGNTAAQKVTDTALSQGRPAITDRSVSKQLARTQLELATARSDGTRSEPASVAYARWVAVLLDMNGIEDSLVTRASSIGLGGSTSQALGDVALVTQGTQLAGQLVPSLMAVSLPGSAADVATARARFLTGWGTYVTVSAKISADTAPPLRTAWIAAQETSDSEQVERDMLSAAIHPQLSGASTLPALGRSALARQGGLNAVLESSLQHANITASEVRSKAARSLIIILSLDALLLIVTLALALLVRGWVSRPLRKLADQAHQVSQGELPDIEIGGPREVRTVALALAEAVVTLRGVQAQASAVADGQLSSDTLKTVLPGSLGRVVHASVARAFDAINERELAQVELAHRATHDPLTELPNRGHALSLISRSLQRAQRTGATTALMFVDLDHFKAVNDTFGHAAGDYVLRAVSRRMVDIVREADMVARLGGDEFVVLIEDLTNETDVFSLADRIVKALSEPMHLDGRQLRIGASVGVAVCRDAHVDGDRLMSEADAAAYRAKAGGRGRVDIFDGALRRQLTKQAEMEAALTSALANEEFVVHYQPVIDLTTGAAVGLEALVRWNRPGIGLISPEDFIPVAESSTLINDIDRYVLTEATRQLAVWTEQEPATNHLTMAVNISGLHVTSPQLIADVTEALTNSGVDADRLIIELTETTLVDDPRSTANMQALRALGVRIALDDFGTGYTSIGQLSELPIDTLKIDRRFTSSTDPSHRELSKLMVLAASALGLSVIAEGDETEHQADLLRHIHIRNSQGFLYATPQPAQVTSQGVV